MKKYLSKVDYILPTIWKKTLLLIILFTIFAAIFELLGIGMVIPFLSIFLGENNFIIDKILLKKSVDTETLVLFFLFLFFVIFLIKNIFLTFVNKIKIDFSHDLAKDISSRLYNEYLKKNYLFFTLRNTSELIRNINGEAHIFAIGVIVPLLSLITDFLVFLVITSFLLYYNPIATLVASIIMIIFGLTLLILQSTRLKSLGLIRQKHSTALLKLITESIGNIKEIILSHNQNYFLGKFKFHLDENAKASKKKDFYFILPRPFLEVMAVGMFLILGFTMMSLDQKSSSIFITLGVFSFASIKLIPTLAGLIRGAQGLINNKAVIDVLYNEFLNPKSDLDLKKIQKIKKNLKFENISLSKVKFSYPNTDNYVLEDVELTINKGDKIGFIGESGSGKTSLINLLSGLLDPNEGTIKLNNNNLNPQINEWQNIIGYVSQNIYLADESLLFNITLKKLGEDIDIQRVNHLIDILDLRKLILLKKNGLNLNVGEKGIQISGGQMQRIGIARALYDKPKVLILDEATNSLDSKTRSKILTKIYDEMKNETIISVSHDLDALKFCDTIFSIEDKKMKHSNIKKLI